MAKAGQIKRILMREIIYESLRKIPSPDVLKIDPMSNFDTLSRKNSLWSWFLIGSVFYESEFDPSAARGNYRKYSNISMIKGIRKDKFWAFAKEEGMLDCAILQDAIELLEAPGPQPIEETQELVEITPRYDLRTVKVPPPSPKKPPEIGQFLAWGVAIACGLATTSVASYIVGIDALGIGLLLGLGGYGIGRIPRRQVI